MDGIGAESSFDNEKGTGLLTFFDIVQYELKLDDVAPFGGGYSQLCFLA